MFIAVGIVGAALLLMSLLFDDVLDGVLPETEWMSGPVIGAFLAAFGLFGWAIDGNTDAAAWVAVIAGVGGGIVLGAFTWRIGKALWNMPTDATPTTAATVGAEGRVVTAIRSGAVGEIVVSLGGQPVKFNATADADIAMGSAVVVIAVESNTKLRVEPAGQFWGGIDPG